MLHQANSGGPAAPSNRALELATGRYVFFLGADDYLGAEALERLVTDGRRAGLRRRARPDGRRRRPLRPPGDLRPATAPDIDLVDSALPWSLSNTKLFRRDADRAARAALPRGHAGRQRPAVHHRGGAPRPGGSRCCADYDYYYAVRRADASNITYRTAVRAWLRGRRDGDGHRVADAGRRPGRQRDAVLRRHFTWELAKLLGTDFLGGSTGDEQRARSDGRRARWPRPTSPTGSATGLDVRAPGPDCGMAQLGDGGRPDARVTGSEPSDRRGYPWSPTATGAYAGYPGFRDPASDFPDEWFDDRRVRSRRPTGPRTVHGDR